MQDRPHETYVKFKYRENSFSVHHLFLRKAIVKEFCTGHSSDTALLCVTFQKDWPTKPSGHMTSKRRFDIVVT